MSAITATSVSSLGPTARGGAAVTGPVERPQEVTVYEKGAVVRPVTFAVYTCPAQPATPAS
jgi:hypothetical protein